MTSEVAYQWHPDVIDDFLALPEHLKTAYLEAVEQIKRDPKLGEHLDRRASTADLSAYRKVKFGDDTDRGPSHRIVYRPPTGQLGPVRVSCHHCSVPR